MSWDGLSDAARAVQQRSRRTLTLEPAWHELHAPHRERPGVVAVDGSHAVLVDNGAVWVVAVRAAAVSWPGTTHDVPIRIHATGPEEAAARLEGAYAPHGLEAPTVHGAEGFAEALRRLAELEALLQGLDDLPQDGLLLVDGALEHLPRHAAELMDRVLNAAARHGVAVAAVAKKSRLEADGIPLVPALRAKAKQMHRSKPWAVAVPGHAMAYVAWLHPQSSHAFRVDVTQETVLHDLLPLCRDAVYTGYPYPLAVAHNAVAISHAQARGLRARLGDEVRRQGGADAWHLLADFHDVLDSNAPRL